MTDYYQENHIDTGEMVEFEDDSYPDYISGEMSLRMYEQLELDKLPEGEIKEKLKEFFADNTGDKWVRPQGDPLLKDGSLRGLLKEKSIRDWEEECNND